MKMNAKRYLLSSFAGLIFILLFEWAFHDHFLAKYYMAQPQLWRPHGQAIMPAIFLALLIFPFVLSFIFVKGYEGKGLPEGVRFGLVMGLLFVPTHLIWYAVQPLQETLVAFWIIGGFVEMILLGIINAAIYKE